MKFILANQNVSGKEVPLLSGNLELNYNMSILNGTRSDKERRCLNLLLFSPGRLSEMLKPSADNDFEMYFRIISIPTDENLVPPSAIKAIPKLTQREIDMLKCLSMGLSQVLISEKLFITLNTVKSHFGNMYDTIGVRNYLCALLTYYRYLSEG